MGDKPASTGDKQALTQFKPGQSGNPKGREKGSRNKLGDQFLMAMQKNFEVHGAETIETVRLEKPEVYVKVIASILPKELNVNVNKYEEMTDDQLKQRLRILQNTIEPFLDDGDDPDSGTITDKTRH